MAISSSKVAVWNRALDRIGSTDKVQEEDEDSTEADVCSRHYDDLLRELLEARDWPWATRERPLSQIDSQSTTTAGDASTVNFDLPYAYLDSQQLEVVLIGSDGSETTLEAGTDYSITDDDPDDDSSRVYVTLVVTPAANESVRITVTTAREGWEHVYVLPADCVTPLALLTEDTRDSRVRIAMREPFEIVENDAGDGLLLCTDLDEDDFVALRYVSAVESVRLMPREFVTALVMRLAMVLAAALKKDEALQEACEKDFDLWLSRASASSKNVAVEVEITSPSLAAFGGASSDDDFNSSGGFNAS